MSSNRRGDRYPRLSRGSASPIPENESTNPFDDDSPNPPKRPSRRQQPPTGGNPFDAAPSPNPFDAPQRPPQRSQGSSNPFDTGPPRRSQGPSRPTGPPQRSQSYSNPFDDSGSSQRNQSTANPFDTGPPQRPAQRSQASANPFDDTGPPQRPPQRSQGSSTPFDNGGPPQRSQQGSSIPFDNGGPLQRPPPQRQQEPPKKPFGEDTTTNPFDSPPQRTNKVASPPRANHKQVASDPFGDETSTNSFGEEPDTIKPQPPQRVPAAPVANLSRQQENHEEKQAILRSMDTDDSSEKSSPSPNRKPSSIANRAKTTGSVDEAAGGVREKKGLASWMRLGKDEHKPVGNAAATPTRKHQMSPSKKSKKCSQFVQWPFDDYHKVQQKFYDNLDAMAPPDHHEGDDAAEANEFMERPAELDDIHTAVQGLSLVDFERKAEQRAIGIVSTWLFDAGLIDELLDSGALYRSVVPASSSASVGETSVKTSEGVEIGAQGMPLEGSLKMDKEINKFRTSTQGELGIINARLNDGVAASGSEVQELVNAVTATKGDLGRLRELSTYIANGGDVEGRNRFMLEKYPKLKTVSSARRNLQRCFRDLEFFSNIPEKCDRLRDDLHRGEWTADEWSTIRNVSMEHVELEVLLVEAEAGMKARADEEENVVEVKRGLTKRASSVGISFRSLESNFHEQIDHFLAPHVKNVWELGDEIRLRVLSGIGSAFDLAMNDPSGMVALVEAVEVYERAAEEYRTIHDESKDKDKKGGLQFTDMRAAALEQVCQDFELRSLEVFRQIQQQVADDAQEDVEVTSNLDSILRAAMGLVREIDNVKNRMAPCFPPYWHVEIIWSTSVAKICSTHILQQIGGPDGHYLPDFTVTQLLDLMAWVEYFRESIEEAFPTVGSIKPTKTYYDQSPQLVLGKTKELDVQSAQDVLAWTNNMLWDVHRLANDEFLHRTKQETEEWVESAYNADHTKNQAADGKLTTSLPEDVFSLANVQLRTIRERLTRQSDALVLSVNLIFGHLRLKQMHSRDGFMEDLETTCAAANDFHRMGEKCEEISEDLEKEGKFSDDAKQNLELSTEELLSVYGRDAVYAAGCIHIYVFEPITEAIGNDLFGAEWENDLTNNDLALTLVRTVEDFMEDIQQYLEPLLLRKAVDSLLRASVSFYVMRLLEKSEKHNGRNSVFVNNTRALERMTGDIKVVRQYFEGLAESMPALKRVIEREFEILTTIHELMSIAAGVSRSDASDFIIVLQKRIRNIDITKPVVGDLWHLVNPAEERTILDAVESLETELMAIAPKDEHAVEEARDHWTVPGLRLDELIATLYLKSRRRRPGKTTLNNVIETWQLPENFKDIRQRGEEIRQKMKMMVKAPEAAEE